MKNYILITLTIILGSYALGGETEDLLKDHKNLGAESKPTWWWSLNYDNCLIVEGAFKKPNNDLEVILLSNTSLNENREVNKQSDAHLGYAKKTLVIKKIFYTTPSILASGIYDDIFKLADKPFEITVWSKVMKVGDKWVPLHPSATTDVVCCLRWRSSIASGDFELDSFIREEDMAILQKSILKKHELDKKWAELSGKWLQEINQKGTHKPSPPIDNTPLDDEGK